MAQRVAESARGARRIRAPRFAMALPAWIWFVCFFTLPVLWIVYYSFGYKPDIYHPIATDKLSFATYREAFSSSFLHVFSQTLQISVLGTALCFLIGFPFAYWLATRVAPRWRGVLLGLVVVPFFVNFLVRTIGWFILLSPNGPVSSQLQRWGIRSEPLHLLETRGAVQLGVAGIHVGDRLPQAAAKADQLFLVLAGRGHGLSLGYGRVVGTIQPPRGAVASGKSRGTGDEQ